MWLAAIIFLLITVPMSRLFSHAYVVYIFYFRHCFSYSHAFCRQTGKNVCFRVSGQRHKGFGILQSFFYEQVHIQSVSVDNHSFIIR